MSKITKQTGPKTKEGKAISSKNAITHGVTSTKIVNQEEERQYQSIIQGLKKQYSTNNILNNLQIERLAKTYIQLMRVQSAIDGLFEKARSHTVIDEKLSKQLDLDIFQKIQLNPGLWESFGYTSRKDDIHNDVYPSLIISSLINNKLDKDDLIEKAPGIAIYLHEEAKARKETVNVYLDRLIHQKPEDAHALRDHIRNVIIGIGAQRNTQVTDEVRESIKYLDQRMFRRFMAWYVEAYHYQIQTSRKLADYEYLMPLETKAAIPNPEELDRLMRYQTTLQRQLSTMMGELMAINK